ncbi:DUF6415 family natural product biosynthesis protein [Streptomyces sp. bgisy060]|uniref:DUF6415 family natural product biosynthesis protein n=1 Tax=Streptomyces sp. bgisy060 TaxID=3413775 RepID=UPI003EBFD8E5
MSLTVLVPPPAGKPRTPQWTPPLTAEDLRSALERIKNWTPLDVEAVFDDLDTAIGNQPPPVVTTGALTDRLRGYLKQLSDITIANGRYPPTAEMVQLVERGRPLRDERTPADYQQAVGFARRLAFVVSDLAEVLIKARYIKGAE